VHAIGASDESGHTSLGSRCADNGCGSAVEGGARTVHACEGLDDEHCATSVRATEEWADDGCGIIRAAEDSSRFGYACSSFERRAEIVSCTGNWR